MSDTFCYIPMINVHVAIYICWQLKFVKQSIFQACALIKFSQPADYIGEMLGNVTIGNRIGLSV